MKSWSPLVVGAIATLSACEPVDLEGALLSCTRDDECPTGQVCDDDGLCSPPSVVVDTLAVDSSAVAPGLIGRPFVDDGAPLEVRFVLNGPTRTAPIVRLNDGLDDVDDVVAVADGSDRAWVARFVVDSDAFEGTARVLVDAVDERGRASTFALPDAVTFDFTGPLPVAAALSRLPDPTRTAVALEILEEDDVGPAVDVRLVFATSEPVQLDDAAPIVVSTGAVPLVFSRDASASNPLIYDLPWPDDAIGGRYDGAHDIAVTLTDLAGNETTTTLRFVDVDDVAGADVGFVVDGTVPALPDVDVDDAIVFERARWGRIDRAEPELYRVVGAAGSVEAGAHVLITREPARLEIDRVIADDDGSFVADALTIADSETLYLRVADAAGNVSAPVAVRDVHWFATPLGKVAGSAIENPHAFHEVPLFGAFLAQGGLVETSGDDVGSLDDSRLSTIGAGTWRRANVSAVSLGEANAVVSGIASSMLVSDPAHGTMLLFGRMQTERGGVPGGFVDNGVCGDVVDELNVRDAEGRWRRVASAFPDGLDVADAAAAFVPPIGQIVVVGAALQTFLFDGTTWTGDCVTDCIDNGAELPNGFRALPRSMAWDVAGQRLVAVLEEGRLAERTATGRWRVSAPLVGADTTVVYNVDAEAVVLATGPLLQRLDGATLSPLCTGNCVTTAPSARPGARVVYDEVAGNYVLFGGAGEVPCSLVTSGRVIASQNQPPEAQQPPATDPPTETWTFQDNRWTRHDVAGPGGRTRHAMRWDPVRQRVLLVGGDDCECLGSRMIGVSPSMVGGYSNDTWEWDGATWTRSDDPRRPRSDFTPADAPAARDHVVVEGGFLGGPMVFVDDTPRVFRDDAWWTTFRGASSAGSRMAAMATAPTGEIFAVAGMDLDDGIFTASARRLSMLSSATPFSTFTPACDDASCDIPVRTFGAAAWHDGERFYVHGGGVFDANIEGDDDDDDFRIQVSGRTVADVATPLLQSFSPDEGWVTRCTDPACSEGAPSKRVLHRVVIDGDGRAVMFGGLVDRQQTTAETWTFDGSAWSPLAGSAPPARAGHVLAWDAARDAVVVAYGTDLGGQPHRFLPGVGLLPLEAHEIPTALSEVWELVDDVWTPAPHADVEGDGRPSPRSSVAGAGIAEGGVLLVGGTPAPAQTFAEAADFSTTTPVSDEAWVWDGGAERAPAHRFAVRADRRVSLRTPSDVLRGLTFTWRSTAHRTNDDTAGPVRLVWWDGNGWVTVDDDERVDCGVGCVRAVLDAGKAHRATTATVDGSVIVAVTSDVNGPAPGRAVLVTDAVEVQLAWRRAATP